jgi:mannosyltransferase OCH1-like enzyme
VEHLGRPSFVIPRVIHRIWLDDDGTDPIPARFEAFWARFGELHPGWDLRTWSDTTQLGWMRCRETFDAQTTHAGRSDVLRYELMASFGGVYVDTDVEPLRPFDDLLDEPRPFAGWEDRNMICPTVLGSPPGHPAVEELIARLPGWAYRHAMRPPNQATGPYFLTHYWRLRTDVRLLDPVAFYPTHWSRKRDLGGPYPPESYAVHHWAASWLPHGPPQR